MSERLFLRLDEDTLQGPESGAPAGSLRSVCVQPALQQHVAHILGYRESFARGEQVLERVVPDGAVRLAFSRSSGGAWVLTVIGPSATPALVPLSGRMEGLAVTLRSGAAAMLLGLPAGEIAGLAVPADQLWTRRDAQDLARATDAVDDAARVQAVQQALLRRLQRARPSDTRAALHALRLLGDSAGRLRVRELAAAVGLGERRLQQLFDACFGLTPRTCGRLLRLQGCLRALRRQPTPAWAELALEAGFSDQAHLVNEFRALLGCTPGAFRRLAAAGAISHSSKTQGPAAATMA